MDRFELSDGKRHKFWEIATSANSVTVRYGRIGTEGQTLTKRLANADAAEREHHKLVNEKARKGYKAVPKAKGTAGAAKSPANHRGNRNKGPLDDDEHGARRLVDPKDKWVTIHSIALADDGRTFAGETGAFGVAAWDASGTLLWQRAVRPSGKKKDYTYETKVELVATSCSCSAGSRRSRSSTRGPEKRRRSIQRKACATWRSRAID